MNIFNRLTAGDSATWDDASFTDTQGGSYAAPLWALRYELRGAQVLTLNAAPNGSGWRTSITAAQSAALVGGMYSWAAYATNGAQRVTAGKGTLQIEADITGAIAGYDGRTQNQKDLDAVRAEIRGRVNGGMTVEYMIGSRSLKKEPSSELLVIESRLVRMVASENAAASIANGLGDPRQFGVRFRRP